MKPDLQLEAYQKLFGDTPLESPLALAHLRSEFPDIEGSVIQKAIETALEARVAYMNAPSTYEQPTPSAAQDAAEAYLRSAVPHISDRLLTKLIGGTMRAWLY